MLNILIVDDEPIAQDIMETYVSKTPDCVVAGKCSNALEAFSFINKQKVDLLLLDINMPEITGMDLLRTLKNPPLVIFTTAYSEYAIESYELNAVDYLMKPVSFDRFLKAIQKAKDLLAVPEKQNAPVAAAGDNMIFVKSDGKLVRIDLKQLFFIEGLKDYVRLWTSQSKVIVHNTMKNFEEQLTQYPNFLRVHKSYIVNLDYVSEIDGNAIKIHDQLITIGNTYRDDIFSFFEKYRI
jgi:DNA-binding LytR/AlgR family response regulator